MEKLTLWEVANATNGTIVSPIDVANVTINGVSIDSRGDLKGKLFVPLKGETNDGHDYIFGAFENGAAACFSQIDIATDKPIIKVENTLKAMQQLAQFYKSKFDIKTVAITGSVGKTSTKDMIANVLSQKAKTLKTEGNFNNDLGLPLTIFNIEETHKFAVLEMGMNHFGEIRLLSQIAKPDVCVITNIGVSHIEFLGSQQGILQAKLEIVEHMNENGTMILNGDDELLRGVKVTSKDILFYGFEEHNHIVCKNFVQTGIEKINFDICYKEEIIAIEMNTPGKHMAQNALAAAAIGFVFGLTNAEIKSGIESATLTKMRMDITKTKTGITVINDAYNSSPQSCFAAIETLKHYNGRKVAILGDMLELGETENKMHEDVAEFAVEQGIDTIIFIGERSRYGYEKAIKIKQGNYFHYEIKANFYKDIDKLIKPLDCVLVKASKGSAFLEVVDAVKQI